MNSISEYWLRLRNWKRDCDIIMAVALNFLLLNVCFLLLADVKQHLHLLHMFCPRNRLPCSINHLQNSLQVQAHGRTCNLVIAMINVSLWLLAVKGCHLASVTLGSCQPVAINKPSFVTTSPTSNPILKRTNTRFSEAVLPYNSAFSDWIRLWELPEPSLKIFCK